MKLMKMFLGVMLFASFLMGCGQKYEFTFEVMETDKRLCPPDDFNVYVTLWDEITYEMKEKDGVYSHTVLENEPFDYYFAMCDQPVWDMRTVADRSSPEPDYYVNDGQGQYNALIIPHQDEEPRSVEFKYYLNDQDIRDFCRGSTKEVSVWIFEDGEYIEYPLKYDEATDAYAASVDITGNVVEFYFSICGMHLSFMEMYKGRFEPDVDYFSDDGQGGFNALYIAD